MFPGSGEMDCTNASWGKVVGFHEILFLCIGNRSRKVGKPVEEKGGPTNDNVSRTVEEPGVQVEHLHVASLVETNRTGDGGASVSLIDMRAALELPDDHPALVWTRVHRPPLNSCMRAHKLFEALGILPLEDGVELKMDFFTRGKVLVDHFAGTGISVICRRGCEFLRL